jgi:hypothetical protein
VGRDAVGTDDEGGSGHRNSEGAQQNADGDRHQDDQVPHLVGANLTPAGVDRDLAGGCSLDLGVLFGRGGLARAPPERNEDEGAERHAGRQDGDQPKRVLDELRDERIDVRQHQNHLDPARNDDLPEQEVGTAGRGADVAFHDFSPSCDGTGYDAGMRSRSVQRLLRELTIYYHIYII